MFVSDYVNDIIHYPFMFAYCIRRKNIVRNNIHLKYNGQSLLFFGINWKLYLSANKYNKTKHFSPNSH